MIATRRALVAVVAGLAALALAPVAPAQATMPEGIAWLTRPVDGHQLGGGRLRYEDVGAGGRVLVLNTPNALVPEDHDGAMDGYVLDLESGERTLVTDGRGAISAIAADVPVVAWSSGGDLMVSDLESGQTTGIGDRGGVAQLSDDGRIALVRDEWPVAEAKWERVYFLVDVATGATTEVARSQDTLYANLSGDGTTVVFASRSLGVVRWRHGQSEQVLASDAQNPAAGDISDDGETFIFFDSTWQGDDTTYLWRGGTSIALDDALGFPRIIGVQLDEDGSSVVFTGSDAIAYHAELDGGVPTQLSSGPVLFARATDDNERIAILDRQSLQLVVRDLHGGTTTICCAPDLPYRNAWSAIPVGDGVVFDTSVEISSNDSADDDIYGWRVGGPDHDVEEPPPPPPVVPTVSIADHTELEPDRGSSPWSFQLTLDQPTTVPVVVEWTTRSTATAANRATEGSDFRSAGGTVWFAPGQTAATVTVEVVGDLRIERDEIFEVVLTGAGWATIGDGVAVGTILNDDPIRLPLALPI